MKYFFQKSGSEVVCRKVTSKTAFIFAVCLYVSREKEAVDYFNMGWNGFWFGKEVLSLSHHSLSTSFASSPTHSRQIFFFFWLHPYSTIPPLPQKTDISPYLPSLNFFSTKYKKLIVHPSQTIPPSSLSLSLSLSSWNCYKIFRKTETSKMICVCVCCVWCGRSETFVCVEWDKNRFDNSNKKNIQVFAFFGSMFSLLFFV